MAVNSDTGDVYVADTGHHRIQQFTSEGEFIRAWGQDVIVNTGVPPNANGTGFEVCDTRTLPANNPTQCKQGITSAQTGGAMNTPAGIAVDQETGNVYVADRGFFRVQVFDADGTFIRAFGRDVIVAAGSPPNSNGTAYEVCDTETVPANTPAQCKTGVSSSTAVGTFNLPNPSTVSYHADLAIAPAGAPNAGNVLITDPLAARVQEFTPQGEFVRSFGGGVVSGGAEGTGTVTSGSPTVTAVSTTARAFAVGQRITGTGIAANTTITAVAATTLTLSQPATVDATGASTALTAPAGDGNNPADEQQRVALPAAANGGVFRLTFTAPNPQSVTASQTTADIPYNAPPDVVEDRLEDLTNIGDGTISVTSTNPGGGSDPGGPYTIAFDGPRYADTNVAQIEAPAHINLTDLTVSSGTKVLAISTPTEGTAAFEVCTDTADCSTGASGSTDGVFATNAVRSIAEDSTGRIYAVEARHNGAAPGNISRVQRFTLASGGELTADGAFACDVLCGTDSGSSVNKSNPQDVAVDGDGNVYVMKNFPAGTGDPPAELDPLSNFQQRVLRVDPDTGQIARVFLGNPGRFGTPPLPMHNDYGLTGLAVAEQGLPLYVPHTPTSSPSPSSRVYRVDEIGGLDAEVSVEGVGASEAVLKATVTPADTSFDTTYRFEYSRLGMDEWSEFSAPLPESQAQRASFGANIGNGADGGESDNCGPSVGSRAAVCHVSQFVDGLERDRVYEYRLVAFTEANGLRYTSEPETFETAASAPAVATGVAVWSGPAATEPSLTLNGRVNPQGAQTGYRFDYVSEDDFDASGFDGAAQAPAAMRDVGQGVVGVDVSTTVAGLDPAADYRYRLVATSPEGTTFGEDRVVAPPGDSDRFVELVSNHSLQGSGVFADVRLLVSDDGERALFTALPSADQQSSPGLTAPSIAVRGESGWEVNTLTPPVSENTVFRGRDERAVDADLTRILWATRPVQGSYRWLFTNLDGTTTPASQLLTPLLREGGGQDRFELMGASLDESTFVFASNSQEGGKTFESDEPLVMGTDARRLSNLYVVRGADSDPELSIVNRGPDGNVVGGACGARLGAAVTGLNGFQAEATRAVSADGSVVFFSARPGNPATCGMLPQFDEVLNPVRIFRHQEDAPTTEVSACAKTAPATCSATGDDFFSGASADGDRVYFVTPRQLADADADSGFSCTAAVGGGSGCDLYLYDAGRSEGQRLTQVSMGEAVAGDHPVPGVGANVLGVVDVSMDGSRVYFVAQGRLTEDATAGAPNLYVFERPETGPDRVSFVASLSPRASTNQYDVADAEVWARASTTKQAYAIPYYDGQGSGRTDGDGHLLLFITEMALLPGEDGDGARDLYRYDDTADEQLECLSCDGDSEEHVSLHRGGGRGVGALRSAAAAVQGQRVASEDGSAVVFTTNERLRPDDLNDRRDVYLWREGEGVSLVTGATGDRGVAGTDVVTVSEIDMGGVISPDGRSVFFVTRASILPEDTNNGALDWYVARVGGGFPRQGDVEECDPLADECADGGDDDTIDSDRVTGSPGPVGNAAPVVRGRLVVRGPGAKARRRAARSGLVVLRVRSASKGRVRVVARARVGGRVRVVGRGSVSLSRPGVARVRVRLSRVARRQLSRGRPLRLTVVARAGELRPGSVRLVLRRAGK